MLKNSYTINQNKFAMITEDSISDQNNENQHSELSGSENLNQQENTAQEEATSPEENTVENSSENTELPVDSTEVLPEENQQQNATIPAADEQQTAQNFEVDATDSEENQAEQESNQKENELQKLSLPEVLSEMEAISKNENAGSFHRDFYLLKDRATWLMNEETEHQKENLSSTDAAETSAETEHPLAGKLSTLITLFREKHDAFTKKQEENNAKHLQERQQIIEKLKNLYTNTEPGTNLFKAIREIKEDWKNAGQVAKSEFKLLNNNYFHHLNQFYQMLDLNKEYLEQEFAHNLEKRQHIIERAKELETEPSVQKALNELQYLHKLWKEEAEPVAEEFREKTWDEFKEISNKIHERKSELSAQIDEEQNKNLERKTQIIEEIKKISSPEKQPNHNYWQTAIKKIEELRTEFLHLGSVPRKFSNQNWTDFKQYLREFNTKKNEFYKGLKNSQQTNLEQKLALIETAKANMMSEDWDVVVPLFKKLQDDWKKIGHVPRSMSNKIWDEFKNACNTFFNNYREKNNTAGDNWKDNFKQKSQLLEELKTITDEPGSIEKIENLKNTWNSIGKVPREKISINTEFNKTLREKLKLNKVETYALKEEGLSENQLTDKARKIKNQISDLEAEIVKLENNLGFFSNSSRENPLLKDTYIKIDEKKVQLEDMKKSLHNILSGENQ